MNAINKHLPSFNIPEFLEGMFAGKVLDLSGAEGLKDHPQMKKFLTTVQTVITDNGFIDDHSGRKVVDHPMYMLYAKSDRLMLVPAYAGGFSINPIEVKDGVAHLSQWSAGGVVSRATSLEEAAKLYNSFEELEYGLDRILAVMIKKPDEIGYTVKAV